MKFSVVAILALGVAPAYSLSYLQSLGTAAPNIAPAVAAPAEAPFFFTNGAKDEPVLAGSYLDNLAGASSATSGAGITSYLDALPKSTVASSGPGLQSYAATLNAAAGPVAPAAAPVAPAARAAPAAPAVSSSPSAPGAIAGSTTGYLENLGGGSTATSGAGITSYTDALIRTSAVAGGAGIASYVNTLFPSSVASGPGLTSYTDALSPFSASSKSSSPFGVAKSTSSIGSKTGKFIFTLKADADMIEKLAAAGDGRVTLTGKIREA
jgi:hypothetical protein